MNCRLVFARAGAVLLSALSAPMASSICRVPQPRIACAEYANSKAVAVAILQTATYVAANNDMDGHLYTLSVRRSLRGEVGTTIQIWEENSSGRATFEWKVGTDYLLFLNPHRSEPMGVWVIDGCGNSGRMNGKRRVLQSIESAARSPDGVVYGIVTEASWTAGVRDVSVEAATSGQTFSAKTDKHGRFKLRLPAGRYALDVNEAGWTFAPEFLSYEDPSGLSVTPGYCAQVQFNGSAEN